MAPLVTQYLGPYGRLADAICIRHMDRRDAGVGTIRDQWGKGPQIGANLNFENFVKKLSVDFSAPKYCQTIARVQTVNVRTCTSKLGGTVWELRVPNFFPGSFLQILWRAEIKFRVTAPEVSLSKEASFDVFRKGGKGIGTPQQLPPK